VLAGVTSTIMFAFSTVPMLVKAGRTKDLSSYSLGNIVLVNIGNVVHSVYVFHLPVGPIWALHLFYVLSSAVQLTLYLRYLPRTRAGPSTVDRSRDGLDDAQVAFGGISEHAQSSLVGRALIGGEPIGITDRSERVDPVGLGHRSSTPFMVAGEPDRRNVGGLRYRRPQCRPTANRDSVPARRDP
jgi:hypothetical protein